MRVAGTLWARSPGGLGPAPPGLGARPTRGLVPTKTTQTSQMKRLLRRWGPGGKRSRDTPPTPPPTTPAFWGCKGERKRVFTLSAFSNLPQGRRTGNPKPLSSKPLKLVPKLSFVWFRTLSYLNPNLSPSHVRRSSLQFMFSRLQVEWAEVCHLPC